MHPNSIYGEVAKPEPAMALRREFDFYRDSFAFANELIWEYRFDSSTGRTTSTRRDPSPDYAHRCFVLARAARQFLYHARFDPDKPIAEAATYRRIIREVLSRSPRAACERSREIVIPGYEHLRHFSEARGPLLKTECGGAWRSYVLVSHWRMIFPISRQHQIRTAERLSAVIGHGGSPIIHLVRFPSLSINHGMVLFEVSETTEGLRFDAYDPNDPEKPASLSFSAATQTFSLPANRYWPGGRVDIIEIYRNWFF